MGQMLGSKLKYASDTANFEWGNRRLQYLEETGIPLSCVHPVTVELKHHAKDV